MTYKIVKQGAKIATKVTKLVAKNSGLDEDTVNVVEGVADAAENQAEAGRDATLADRVKMAAGDTTGIVGDNVDNQYVSVIDSSWGEERGVASSTLKLNTIHSLIVRHIAFKRRRSSATTIYL